MGHDDVDEPKEHEIGDFVPDEFDAVPSYASTETKWLYLFAVGVQVGQIVVTAWGLNQLSKPALDTQDTIVTVAVMIIAVVFCVRAWSAAYHSAADDKYREELRGPRATP